jgi:flagellar hook-associated protein 2
MILQSNQNSISGVIAGLVLDLHAASSTPVIVTVDRNDEVALDAIHGFVDAFNQVVDLLRSVDSYDIESGAKGALLGDPTVARVSRAMYDLVLQELETGGGFNGLWEVGIRMGAAGHLELDEAVLSEALTSNRAGVEALFLADDGDMQGYAVRFDALLESLTATEGGLLSVADDRFADQIESTSAGIARLDMRLDARRSRLVAQFVAMEQAIAVLQSQNAALLSLQSALFASSDG